MLRKIMIVVTTSLALSAGLASDALERGDPAAAATAAASATPGTWGGVPSTAAGGGRQQQLELFRSVVARQRR
jgi:hypothetical protein